MRVVKRRYSLVVIFVVLSFLLLFQQQHLFEITAVVKNDPQTIQFLLRSGYAVFFIFLSFSNNIFFVFFLAPTLTLVIRINDEFVISVFFFCFRTKLIDCVVMALLRCTSPFDRTHNSPSRLSYQRFVFLFQRKNIFMFPNYENNKTETTNWSWSMAPNWSLRCATAHRSIWQRHNSDIIFTHFLFFVLTSTSYNNCDMLYSRWSFRRSRDRSAITSPFDTTHRRHQTYVSFCW